MPSTIEHMHITNLMFISTVLCNFAIIHKIPGNAIGELQLLGILRELCVVLKWPDGTYEEYREHILSVPNPSTAQPVIPDSLNALIQAETPVPILKKYHITPDTLVCNFNFGMLDDCTMLDNVSNASPNCEHHDKWLKDRSHCLSATMRECMRVTRKRAKETNEAIPPAETNDLDTLLEL